MNVAPWRETTEALLFLTLLHILPGPRTLTPHLMSHHTTPTIPAKHGAIWFPDGDILLSTRSIDSRSQESEVRYIQTLFRVHKSILASHSIIFQDALTSTNDKLSTTTVHLPDDTSELEIFLGLMYGKNWLVNYYMTIFFESFLLTLLKVLSLWSPSIERCSDFEKFY